MAGLKLITTQAVTSYSNIRTGALELGTNGGLSISRESIGVVITASLNKENLFQIVLNDNDVEALGEALAEILQSRETLQ